MQEFLDFLASIGAEPSRQSDIKATGQIIRFNVKGEKPQSRNGRCALYDHGGGFMAGWAMNMREGVKHNWHSKATRKMNDKERREYAKRIEADKKAREAETKAGYAKAAETAKWVWQKAEKVYKHPYLERKGISGKGSRLYKGSLVVPAWKNGTLTSLQFIAADGEKRFLKLGDIQGAYGSLGKDTRRIYISEGFATASSIYEAVQPFVSVWSFNAGNLMAVYQTIRAKYPDAVITICADNDQWSTRPDGTLYNAGMLKAAEINELIAWPDFANDDPDRRTDFNDYALAYGIDRLRERLSQATVARGEAQDIPDVDSVVAFNAPSPPNYETWKERLICKENGALVKGSLRNVILMLEHHQSYEGVFKLNEFDQEIYVCKPTPWDDLSAFYVRKLQDNDITQCAAEIEAFGLSSDGGKVFSAIKVVAERSSFHPAREYFDGLKWDGVCRLEKWLPYYMGAEDDDLDYLAFAGKKWLTAAVKRVYEPGCKFDHVLVAEGKQGKGKSTAFEYLATFGRDKQESYFSDNIKISDIQNKDTILLLQGSIIVELAEMAGFNKKEDDEIKGWITIKEDRCRVPYGRTISTFPRQFVLCATVNNYEYLKDPTGNRRYWPFKANSIDLEAIKTDREQLWAEAVHYYKQGMYIGPTPEEIKLAEVAQQKRLSIDPLEDDVMEALSKCNWQSAVKLADVLREMGFNMKDRADSRLSGKVMKILRQNGYENEPRKINGRSQRILVKHD